MRDVCLIVEGAYPRVTGGVAAWVHQLVSGLPELSFSVLSLVPADGVELPVVYAAPPGVEVIEVPFDFEHGRDTRAVEAAAPDAAAYHAASTGFAGAVGARVAAARNRPSLLTEHGVAWNEARHGALVGDGYKHGPHGRAAAAIDRRAWAELHEGLAREAYAGAAAITGVSPWTVRLQRSLGARSTLLANGVPLPAAAAAGEPAAAGERAAERAGRAPRIGFVGRVAPVKDVVTFLRACRLVADELPGAEFVVVGPLHHHPLYSERCIAEVARLGLGDRVEFVGEADPGPWYATLDALVLTSVSEAQPLVALEAMAAGVPVVATAVGGCPELIGGAGLLTRPGDPRSTAAAVLRVLGDAELHDRLVAAGRARVDSSHRLDRVLAGYSALYRTAA